MAAAPGTLAVAPPHLLESMFPGMEFPRPFANGDVANSLANGESARLAQADVANSFYETGKRAGDNRRGGSSSVAGSSAAATSSSGAVDAADVAGLHAQRDAVLRGFEITEPARDDKETGEKAKYMASILEAYQKLLEERTQYHFGYPYNLDFDYGALIGLQHFSINNLGDPFIESNYGVHSRPFEVGVLNWFARLWDLDEGDYWGYITNCGTEGNLHGILVGLLCPLGPLPPLPLRLSSSHCPSSSPPPTSVPSSLPSPSREVLPKGVLYATRESHYSVFMAARMYRMECEKVATHTAGETGTQSFPSLLTPSLPLRPPRREVLPAGVLYASRESHYSVFKAARIYRMEREKSCGDTHKHTRSSPLPCSLSPKREVLPDGVLYATRESHYSVFKAARMYRMECEKVATHTARDIEVCFSQDGTCLSFSPSPLSQEGGPARRDGVLYASRESHYSVFKAARMYRMECEKVATHTAGDIEVCFSQDGTCLSFSPSPLSQEGGPARRDGVLYASRESHYSVFKAARMYRMECEKVATHTAGDIDCRDLAGKLARHRGRPAILNVNIGTHHGEGSSGRSQPGTTVKGAVDDLDLAITTLHEAGLSDHQLSPPRVLPSHVLNLRLLPSPGSLSSSPWLGAVDDLDLVITTLHEAGLSDEQFYIHCDGALFGLMLPFVKKVRGGLGTVQTAGHGCCRSAIQHISGAGVVCQESHSHEAGLSDDQCYIHCDKALFSLMLPFVKKVRSAEYAVSSAMQHTSVLVPGELLHEAGLSDEQCYIHCDGALFGLMLPFVKKAPRVTFKKPIGSVSVSGHKFAGCPMPCGVQCVCINPISPIRILPLHTFHPPGPQRDAPSVTFKKPIGSVSVSGHKFVGCPMPCGVQCAPSVTFKKPIGSVSVSGHKFAGCPMPCGVQIMRRCYLSALSSDAPRVTFKKPIGSVSVSGHKFVGCPMPCGVQIMRRCYLSALSSDIEYLASRDATIMGSRNGHAPIFLWYTLNKKGYRGFRKDVQRCLRNALHLHARLRAAGFGAMLNTLSSTVVFERPEEEAFVRRWQLACQGKVAHAVVMPSVSPEKVDLFVREFVASRERCRAAKAAADDDDDDDDDATAAAAAAAAAAATAAAATAADGSAAGGSTAGAAAVANGSAATSTDALTSDVCVADVIGPENCSCAAHVAIWRTRIEQDAVGRRRYSCYSDTSGDDASLHGSSSVQRLSSSVQRLS
ncbi:unnamed protein product [Closterium sp. NIES-65]|nr:unnamed protein product [Closterium sp. NIES-65]